MYYFTPEWLYYPLVPVQYDQLMRTQVIEDSQISHEISRVGNEGVMGEKF